MIDEKHKAISHRLKSLAMTRRRELQHRGIAIQYGSDAVDLISLVEVG